MYTFMLQSRDRKLSNQIQQLLSKENMQNAENILVQNTSYYRYMQEHTCISGVFCTNTSLANFTAHYHTVAYHLPHWSPLRKYLLTHIQRPPIQAAFCVRHSSPAWHRPPSGISPSAQDQV